VVDDDDIPNCFGDESEHDPDHDRHCKVCDIRDACGAEVRAARKKRIRDRALGRPSSTVQHASPSREATTPSQILNRRRMGRDESPSRGDVPVMRRDVSFWTALGHNTMLETMSAILKEFWYSVTQIPRLEYRSPWDLYEDKKPPEEK
jgi:hypothetical protein